MDGTTSGFYDTCEKMHATPLRPRDYKKFKLCIARDSWSWMFLAVTHSFVLNVNIEKWVDLRLVVGTE